MTREPSTHLTVIEDQPGVQWLVIDDLVSRVQDLCATRPVALCIDDLHWADASTLAAVAALVRGGSDLLLLVALATRPVPRGGELAAFLHMLDVPPTGVHVARIELGPLNPRK